VGGCWSLKPRAREPTIKVVGRVRAFSTEAVGGQALKLLRYVEREQWVRAAPAAVAPAPRGGAQKSLPSGRGRVNPGLKREISGRGTQDEAGRSRRGDALARAATVPSPNVGLCPNCGFKLL